MFYFNIHQNSSILAIKVNFIDVKKSWDMRKTIVLLYSFLCISISSSAIAQIRVGFTGGIVLSSLVRDSNLALHDGNFGFLVGANAKYNLGDLGWYVQSGIDFTKEGDSQQNLSFVKIPLIVGLDASDDVSVFVTYNLAWQVGDHNNVQQFYHGFANILGFGTEIHVSKAFAIGARLNYGLSNLVSVPAEAKNFSVKPFTFEVFTTFRIN